MFNVGASAGSWHDVWSGSFTIPGSGPFVSFALVPAASSVSEPHYFRFGETVVDLHLPTDRPGLELRCRIDVSSQHLSPNLPLYFARLRRDIHRTVNQRSSAWAIAGMVLLLAVCGFIVEGTEGACRAISTGGPRANNRAISPDAMSRWFGARRLSAADMPGLFAILADVCRRARLPRMPDLYYVAGRNDMNAYALGGPESAAIVLTDGLLHGMTPGEMTGILAHEVAHICNNDAWAMDWMDALRRAIEWTSSIGLASVRGRHGGCAISPLLEALLGAAPAIGHLLGLALCRTRELDADATALELTGDLLGLIAALDKLERHHTGAPVRSFATIEDGSRLFRSHPATSERVGTLLSLAH